MEDIGETGRILAGALAQARVMGSESHPLRPVASVWQYATVCRLGGIIFLSAAALGVCQRARAAAPDELASPGGYLTTATTRTAIDHLRSARVRRESYVGPWLPEPLISHSTAHSAGPAQRDGDPAEQITLDDQISYALLVVLETLTPAERTSWVLHDLFGMPFAEVAEVAGRTPAAVRQLAARARIHVDARTPRVAVTATQHDAGSRDARLSGVAAALSWSASPRGARRPGARTPRRWPLCAPAPVR